MTASPPDPQRSRRRALFAAGRGTRPGLAFVVAMVLVIGAAELSVRAAASRLPEPLNQFSSLAQGVVDDMKLLQSKGIRSDLTFVGTSMVRRGVDAGRVEKEFGWSDTSVHNVALPGAQTEVVERWMLEEVIPRIHPKRVVWGVSTIDFNGNRPGKTIDIYNKSRAGEHGFFGDLDRFMQHSALSEHRSALKDPFQIKATLQGNAAKFEQQRNIKFRATWKLEAPNFSAKRLARLRANHRKTVHDRQLYKFATGPKELRAFSHTISEMKRQGIDVVIVVMPVPKRFLIQHPHGEADFLAWQSEMTKTAKDAGADAVLDLSRTMRDAGMADPPDDAFRDYEHMWPDAARNEFSPLLVRELKKLGWK